MKAVARLVWSYFTGTPMLRAFTIAGSILLCRRLLHPDRRSRSPSDKLWLAILGLMLFFLGSSLMPVMFGRLARSHSIGVLPGGRWKLLLSAFVTILLVALPVGILSPASFIVGKRQPSGDHKDPGRAITSCSWPRSPSRRR